jgi:coiled-coil domain-containing protein 12
VYWFDSIESHHFHNMSSNHATLDAAATERKARLAKLAALKRKQPEPEPLTEDRAKDDEMEDATPDVTAKYLSGRNYDAETRGPKLGFDQAPADGQITVESQAAEIAKATAEQAKKDEEADQPIDLFKLQPKKPNWDLKRDLDVKMNTLNARTQNAIARLVRQRIENAQRTAKAKSAGSNGEQSGEDVGIEGEMLVEGIHVREREDEDERREREEDDLA